MPSVHPSITYWNRLEPRPRAPRISETLAAAVRDPLWMLTRQWQFGEFQGEDAGSPASIELVAQVSPLTSWRPAGGVSAPLSATRPLEPVVQNEPFPADLATRVELGHTFTALMAERLGTAVPPALVASFRRAYPIGATPGARQLALLFHVDWDVSTADPAPGGTVAPALLAAFGTAAVDLAPESSAGAVDAAGPWLVSDALTGRTYLALATATGLDVYLAAVPDPAEASFRLVCAGRAIDGVALHQAGLGAAEPAPLDDPALPAAQRAAGRQALGDLHAWVADVYGDVGSATPAAWLPDRLTYTFGVTAPTAAGGTVTLSGTPDRDGDFGWYAMDRAGGTSTGGDPTRVKQLRQSTLPVHVRFRGMPNARWWTFERAGSDFGAVIPDGRDLAKLIVMDFMLVHSNDWFVIPVDQPVGSLLTVGALLVHDVFGDTFLVERADVTGTGPPPKPGERWSMFATTDAAAGGIAPFFVLPPSVGTAAQTGPTVEEVRFLRDEGANLVWAVEHTTENALGEAWSGHERDFAVKAVEQPAVLPPTAAAWRYVIQTSTPENWIPFLPATADPARGRVLLEQGSMLSASGGLTAPAGRLLPGTPTIWEEEVPRTGVAVRRVTARSRWSDGSTHVWIARRSAPAQGEASSGLLFDQAVPTTTDVTG